MAKKVKALFTFVGSAEELKEYGGQTPPHQKHREDKLSEADRVNLSGKITIGTEMEVADARATTLQSLGLVEVLGEAGEDKPEKKEDEKDVVKETEKLSNISGDHKVANILVSDKKKEKAESNNPGAKATKENTKK